MTLREAADQLGITPDSLRQAIARGTLKASKRGRDWWVTEKQLKQWKGADKKAGLQSWEYREWRRQNVLNGE